MNAKYIIYKDTNDLEHAVIFDKIVNHSSIKQALKSSFCYALKDEDFISAGFVELTNLQCYGDSFTLKLKSRGDIDTKVMELLFSL